MDVVTVPAPIRQRAVLGTGLHREGSCSRRLLRRGLVPLLIPIALLASCGVGGDDPLEGTAQSTDEVLVGEAAFDRSRPACPDVIAPGATLPVDLHEGGCRQGDGTILLPGVFVCDDGRELLVNHHLAGYLGDEASAMDASDEEYATLFEECHR